MLQRQINLYATSKLLLFHSTRMTEDDNVVSEGTKETSDVLSSAE